MGSILKHRRGSAAQWDAANPVLQVSEIGYETPSGSGPGKFKIGDGVSTWSSLPYFVPESVMQSDYLTTLAFQEIEGRLAPDYRGLPDRMTSDPVVAYAGTGITPTIPDYVEIEPDAINAVSYVGAVPMRGATYPESAMLNSNIGGVTVTGLYNYPPWYMRFDHDGSVLEFITRGKGSLGAFRVLIDGEYAGDRQLNSVADDGILTLVKLSFESRKRRRIQIEMNGLFSVGKFFIEPTASLWAAPVPGPRVCFLGDSWTEPTIIDSSGETFTGHDGWATIASRLLGWEDRFILGSGGTGYLNPGMSGRVKFRDRVDNDVIARDPDIVVVAGGFNDVAFDDEDIAVEAGLLFNEILEGLPHVRLYVVSPFAVEPPDSALLATSAAIEAVVPTEAYFINVLNPNIITGNGDQGTPNESGNADVYIGGDTQHPTKAGHEYIGRRIAALIRATLP